MGKFLRASVIACVCAAATGCASAPINVVGSALPSTAAVATQTQQSLRGAASRLQNVFEERGWIRAAQSMRAATQGWMARLTGQHEGDDSPAETEAVPYLAYSNFSTMDSAVAVARLTTDIDEAQDLVRDVDMAAAHLIGREDGVTRSSLTRDLELVERAVAQSREALETFDRAIETVAAHADEDAIAQLRSHREILARHSEHLRDRADEIAHIRRTMRADASS